MDNDVSSPQPRNRKGSTMAPLGEYEFFKTSNPSSSASPSTPLVTEGGNGRDGRDSPTSGLHGEDLETNGTVS